MNRPSAFERRAWEKYPIYYTDEEHDNLDDDPRERRNTSQTLAEELAIYEKKELAIASRQKQNLSADPEKRIKARIGKRFLQTRDAATVVGSQDTQKNHGKDSPGLGKVKTDIQRTAFQVAGCKTLHVR